MPLMPTAAPIARRTASLTGYHQIAFQYMFRVYRDQIDEAVIQTGLQFRSENFRRSIRKEVPDDHHELWSLVRPYLEKIEKEIERRVKRHSAFYWYHLYRRIAPILSPNHDGKTDWNTAALVREISDQSFVKYGSDRTDDIVPISSTNVNTLLGGYFYKSAESIKPGSAIKIFAQLSREQWVIKDFELNDMLEIHRLESLFYEYWKTTAALRTIGKGSFGKWNDDFNWINYDSGSVDSDLYELYDSNMGRHAGLHSLIGTWYSDIESKSNQLFFLWAQYNSNREIISNKISNFRVGLSPINEFWSVHSFLSKEFRAVHNVELSALIYMLAALSAAAISPVRFIDEELSENNIRILFESNSENLSMRGYVLFMYDKERLIDHAIGISKIIDNEGLDIKVEDLQVAFDFLKYNKEHKEQVSLWAGGKKFPIIPFGNYYLFDIASVNKWCETLFFRVADRIGAKGFVFEESLRKFLSGEGYDVFHHGEIHWPDGSTREADALVRIQDRLFVIECIASERPLDFEISEPKKFDKRKSILTEKSDQARSLALKISQNPKTSVDDFSWAESVEWFVVSHLPEFIWTKNYPAMDNGLPRIVDPQMLTQALNRFKTKKEIH